MISPEAAPYASSGGLGDVLGSLPAALERLGVKVSLILPAHRSTLRSSLRIEDTGVRFTVPISSRQEEGRLLKTTASKDISVYFIRADKYFDRDSLYTTPEGDYPDNAERFAFFGRAALEALKREPPDILHAHDWQAASAITFLKAQTQFYPQLSNVKTVFTVHNLGFQGLFPPQDWHLLNLGEEFFTPQYLEFYGRVNFIKGGLVLSDAITTVSPGYAAEIKTMEQGFGLDGIFQERAASLTGILNGVDYSLWNPETDRLISRNYSAANLAGKKNCKTVLQSAFSLTSKPDFPLIGMVSRLTSQKGFDLIERTLDGLMNRDIQLVILGAGEKHYQDFLTHAVSKYPQKLAVKIAYNEALSHQIIAGSDILLMPSRYEPCGLTQLYAFKYGTVPIVHATGGLKDTVQQYDPLTEKGNGFVTESYESANLLAAADRALEVFRQGEKWQALMKADMKLDFSWDKPARAYLELYQRLVK